MRLLESCTGKAIRVLVVRSASYPRVSLMDLYRASLAGFMYQLKDMWGEPTSQWNGVDWINGSDGCSVPKKIVDNLNIDDKDKPGGFHSLPSCYQHHFGYGNYKEQKRFTEDNRGKD